MIPAKQSTHSKLLIHVGAVIITIITTLCTHTYSHCSLDMQRKCGFLMLFITAIVFLGSWGGKILNISLRFLLVFAVGCVLSWRDIAYADNHRTSHLLPDLCHWPPAPLSPVIRENWNFWISCSPHTSPREPGALPQAHLPMTSSQPEPLYHCHSNMEP